VREEFLMGVEVFIDSRATIGESPTWSEGGQALYWIDVKKPALYRYDMATAQQHVWDLTSDVGAFALIDDDSAAVVALREGIYRLDFESGSLTRLVQAPFDPKLFRFNEGACDATGRFWVGVMFDPLDEGAPPERASLHSFTLDGGLNPEPDAAELHNGMAWSPDGKTFYLSHSYRREVFAHAFDAARGRIGARRKFAQLPEDLGIPDGACVDIDGGYWCALYGGGRLRRYSAAGAVDTEVLLPVSQPTMCAFGGKDLEEMFVTSARDKLTAEQLRREPHAGAMFRLRPGKRGVPRRCAVR
jgi:sugar lactone lactonase YvrE